MLPSRLLATCLSLAAANWAFCEDRALTRFEFSQAHMGTQFRIIFYAPDASTATQAATGAFNRIAELDSIMSDYRPDSELTALCQRAGGPPVKVSEDLFRVLAKSQEIARKSYGAFDITVGPLVRLWRRARRQHELPDPENLAQVLQLVGYENLRLDPVARTAQLVKRGMLLDLGGIAKGDAADQALLALRQYGIHSALVAGGGDIAAGAPPPERQHGAGWRIGIASLDSPNEHTTRFISLHDAGISTSGDAGQHVEISGVRYSHIISPKTGMALAGRSSVTIIAPDDISADALATTVSVLGPERGLKLIDSIPGTAALIMQLAEHGLRKFESHFPPADSATPSPKPADHLLPKPEGMNQAIHRFSAKTKHRT